MGSVELTQLGCLAPVLAAHAPFLAPASPSRIHRSSSERAGASLHLGQAVVEGQRVSDWAKRLVAETSAPPLCSKAPQPRGHRATTGGIDRHGACVVSGPAHLVQSAPWLASKHLCIPATVVVAGNPPGGGTLPAAPLESMPAGANARVGPLDGQWAALSLTDTGPPYGPGLLLSAASAGVSQAPVSCSVWPSRRAGREYRHEGAPGRAQRVTVQEGAALLVSVSHLVTQPRTSATAVQPNTLPPLT